MKVSKVFLTVLVASLLIGTGVIAGTAYAQEDDPPAGSPTLPDRLFFGRGPGRGVGSGMMAAEGDHPLHEYIVAAVADVFGLSVATLESRLEAGETMMEIALATGLSQEDAWELMKDAHQAALEAAQADGIELPAFGTRGNSLQGEWDGDCPMDGSGPAGRVMSGMRGFRAAAATQ